MEDHLMKTDNIQKQRADRVWLTEAACDLEDFRAEVERTTVACRLSACGAVEKNVLIYDSRLKASAISTQRARRAVLAEICEAFATGPGVVVLKRRLRGHGRHRPRQRDFR
jgi:hypothetical protein